MTTRIRWSEDGFAVWSGYAGECGAQLFTIAAPPPDSGKGYLLMSRLSGMDFSCSRSRLEEAQAEAERWLAQFVTSLGAVFPCEPGMALVAIEEEGRPAAFFDEHDLTVIARAATRPAATAADTEE